MFSDSSDKSLIAKYKSTVDSTLQKPENGDVNLETLELIKVNKLAILAITTGILAITIALAIVKKDLFFCFLNPY